MLKWHLARSVSVDGPKRLRLKLADCASKSHPLMASLHKDESFIEVGLDLGPALARRFVYRMLYARLPGVIRILARTRTNVRTMTADLSDGGNGPPAALSFCSNRDDALLIPDPVFVNSEGYARFRGSDLARPWPQRHDTVLWRGTSTGIGAIATETIDPTDSRLRQRVRMCAILRSVPGTDAKISKTETDASPSDRARLASENLLGDKIRQAAWGRYKFALDVDGHTNAWSNFFVRLLLGCCVLKIASEHGFRQWYYDQLKPWKHFVPVRADMSDLREKIEWSRQHDDRCAEIAAAGRAFALAHTVESELADAARRLDAAARLA
jgi:hypothetical protein